MLASLLLGLLAVPSSSPDSARVQGRLQHAPPQCWAYVYRPEGPLARAACLDSARLDGKGRFALRFPLPDGPEYYRLRFAGLQVATAFPVRPADIVTFEGNANSDNSMFIRYTGTLAVDLETQMLNLYLGLMNTGSPEKKARRQAEVRQLVRQQLPSFQAAHWTFAYLAPDPDQRVFVDSVTNVLRRRLPDSRYTRQLDARQQRQTALQPGQPAPPFSLPLSTGDSLRLSSLRGQYVLLHCWNALGLGKDIRLSPGGHLADVIPLHQWAQGKPVQLVSVGFGVDTARLRQELRTLPAVQWPMATAVGAYKGRLAADYGINRTPSFILIGPDGRLLALALDLDEARKQLRQLLP